MTPESCQWRRMLKKWVELEVAIFRHTLQTELQLGGRRGVVVTRLIRSAKLLYAGPG